MNSMPSMDCFKRRFLEFILLHAEVEEGKMEDTLNQIEQFVAHTGGWEGHYGMMFEGVCKGYTFEEQLKMSEHIWKKIKFNFGEE